MAGDIAVHLAGVDDALEQTIRILEELHRRHPRSKPLEAPHATDLQLIESMCYELAQMCRHQQHVILALVKRQEGGGDGG